MTHLIARLYDATSGTVSVAGTRRPEADAGVAARRGRLRHPGRPHVPRHDPRESALRPARRHRRTRCGRRWRRPRSKTLVESLPDGLDTVVGERGYRLSGGERQRLAIARLLLKAPPIVVLDEATAHLDSESEVAVQQALDLAMEGRTSIVIAHRLSTVRNADLIIVVDQGRIVQRGRHDRAAGRRRPLRRALPHPVRRPGSRAVPRSPRTDRHGDGHRRSAGPDPRPGRPAVDDHDGRRSAPSTPGRSPTRASRPTR